MENIRIDDTGPTREIDLLKLKGKLRWCIHYKEEICRAPKMLFKICPTCYRIDPRTASKSLFNKIKELANKFFNFQETELG